jgi:hypothetical protein
MRYASRTAHEHAHTVPQPSQIAFWMLDLGKAPPSLALAVLVHDCSTSVLQPLHGICV